MTANGAVWHAKPARQIGPGSFRLALILMMALPCAASAVPALQRPDSVNVGVALAIALLAFGTVLAATIGPTRLSVWLMILFIVRLVVALVYHQIHWSDGEQLYGMGLTAYDAYRYDDSARQVVLHGWDLASISVDQLGPVASYAAVYALLGYNPVFGVILNSLFGALTAVIIHYLAKPTTSRWVSQVAALVVMVLPDSLLYGGQLMKEMLVTVLFAAAILGWQMFQRDGRRRGLLVFLGGLYGLLETRAVYLVILTLTVGVLVAIERRIFFKRPFAVALLGLSLAGLATAGVSNYARGVNMLSPAVWIERYNELRRSSVDAISAESADPRASIGMRTAIDPAVPATLAYVPFRIGAFYLTPPFWLWGTLPDFVPFVEISAILSWVSLPAVLWGLWRLGRQPRGYYLWVPFIVSTAVISVATPFVDVRYKVALMPLFALLAVLGFEQYRRWRRLYVPYAVVMLSMMAGYYGLKMILRG